MRVTWENAARCDDAPPVGSLADPSKAGGCQAFAASESNGLPAPRYAGGGQSDQNVEVATKGAVCGLTRPSLRGSAAAHFRYYHQSATPPPISLAIVSAMARRHTDWLISARLSLRADNHSFRWCMNV